MAEPIQKQTEDIIIRTMKGDLDGPAPSVPVPKLPPIETKSPLTPISKETAYKAPQAPITPVIPIAPKTERRDEAQRNTTPALGRPPILIVPPKIIPPKEIPEIPVKPLYKATPAWLKLGGIGLVIIGIALSGLYGYWKIFIQSKPPATSVNPPVSTTTLPALPLAPSATSTAPAGFFSKLPNKSITIDLPAITPTALTQALKSEARVEETRATVKQIKITFQGEPITIGNFFSLLSIFTPKDFLLNYEDEFAFAYFNHNYLKQEEGIRSILILKAKNKGLAETQMADWEKTTLANDILPLFLNDLKLPQYLPSFRSYLFVNQPVRYLNIGVAYTSLNYSIYNNLLIFSTSSAGMYTILQDLIGQSVSMDYLKSLEASINSFVE